MHPLLQSNCSSFSKTFTVPPGVQVDSQFHLDSTFHSVTVFKTSACTYTNGASTNGNCDTQCNVTTPVDVLETAGFGSLSSFCHATGKDIDNTHATATAVGAGAKCGGAGGGAVESCFACACNVNVKVTKGPVDVTITSDGFFNFKDGVDGDCPAQVQPKPSPTPVATGGGLPPDPCLNSATVSGPSGNFGTTGGSGNKPDCSPIIVDLTGEGFFLTDATHGVKFDIANTGFPVQIAWTANSNNAFLVLDRNGNGVINSGAEMFGNFTSQPSSEHPNGFLALAVYDDPANGGNGDGVIDARDRIFSLLRLWVDANHDGISQSGELHTLPEMGITSIGLDYTLTGRIDEFGNVFRYKAKVNQGQHGDSDVGRKAYDVFLVTQ